MTLSQPIPVFASPVRYQKNEDFKSRLSLNSWMFFVYIADAQLAVFWIDNNNYSKEYRHNNLMSQKVAQSCVNAMEQLDSQDVVCLPACGSLFFADDNDNVAIIKSPFDDTVYPVITFDRFNSAVNRMINESEEYPPGGGGVFLDKLYNTSYSGAFGNTNDLATTIIVTASCALAIVCVSIMVNKRKRSRVHGSRLFGK